MTRLTHVIVPTHNSEHDLTWYVPSRLPVLFRFGTPALAKEDRAGVTKNLAVHFFSSEALYKLPIIGLVHV